MDSLSLFYRSNNNTWLYSFSRPLCANYVIKWTRQGMAKDIDQLNNFKVSPWLCKMNNIDDDVSFQQDYVGCELKGCKVSQNNIGFRVFIITCSAPKGWARGITVCFCQGFAFEFFSKPMDITYYNILCVWVSKEKCTGNIKQYFKNELKELTECSASTIYILWTKCRNRISTLLLQRNVS